MNWKTHSKCCTCKEYFFKTELINGINCFKCNEENKIHKISEQSKIITKQKNSKCSKCNKIIKIGEKAISERIELINGKDYSIYYHLKCTNGK